MSLTLGDPLPDLELSATGGAPIRLGDLCNRPLVLFFYPKAGTPGCTQEGQDFRDALEEFTALGATVLGASRDGLKAQERFKARQGFPFELLSDPDEILCSRFDVLRMKQMFGRQVHGIERSIFLFDAQGILRQAWRKVQVKGHVAAVLAALRTLAAQG